MSHRYDRRAHQPRGSIIDSEPRQLRDRHRFSHRWRVNAALIVLVVVALGPLVKPLTVQPGSRLALSAALAEHGTVRIDDYRSITKPGDRVDAADGHLYSDKGPGQPLLAVPFYALSRAIGAESATVVRVQGNLTLWWVTLWSSVVPAAVLVALMHVAVARRRPGAAVPVALSVLFATPLVVWSVELYGHLLATTLVFGAWVILGGSKRTTRGALAAGAMAGWAVATENPTIVVVASLMVVLALGRDWRRLSWFVVGMIPSAGLVLAYNAIAFGSPFTSGYSLHLGAGGSTQSDLATGPPRLDVIFRLIAGDRGFILTPLVLLGLGISMYIATTGRPERRDASLALAVFGGFLLFEATRRTNWPGPLGGEMPAPRHFLPALPFLAVPLSMAWQRLRPLYLLCVAVGIATMALPTLVLHLIPDGASYFAWYRHLLVEDGVSPTIFTLALGRLGWVLHGACVVVAAWWLSRVMRLPPAKGISQASTSSST